jgi:hypothetical protein
VQGAARHCDLLDLVGIEQLLELAIRDYIRPTAAAIGEQAESGDHHQAGDDQPDGG